MNCVDKIKAQGMLPKHLHVLVGDQEHPEVLQGWIKESGGMFDVVIDDGGHTNKQIKTSFDYLWPHVKPGGLYFLEDLQVGRGQEKSGDPVVSDIIQDWIEQLLTSSRNGGRPAKYTHELPDSVD